MPIKLSAAGWIDLAARCAHEANRGYCQSLGDDSQVPWDQAPANIRQSAIDGVRFITKHPNAPPSASHENWLKFKEADGWVYGPVKDPDKKTHPCMVPFEELPQEQRSKDYLFNGVVKAVLGL